MQNYPPNNSKKTKSTPITYRRMRNRLVKYGAIGFILNAAIYLITEFIAALSTNQDLGYVYSKQFISALGVYPGQIADGVPNNFSPLAIVMNLGFIVTAFGFSISYALLLYPKFKDINTKLACSLMMVASWLGFFKAVSPTKLPYMALEPDYHSSWEILPYFSPESF